MIGTENQTVRVHQPASMLSERVTAAPLSAGRAYLTKPDDQWGWTDLRDFVAHEIELRFGPIRSRDAAKEAGIFKRFLKDWPGGVGVMIARHAFSPEACDGWWNSAPISLERFCRASDEYFAVPIGMRLADAADAQRGGG